MRAAVPRLGWLEGRRDSRFLGSAPPPRARPPPPSQAKFMLPWSFSEEAAAEKHVAQLQHCMLEAGARRASLSIITGGASGC